SGSSVQPLITPSDSRISSKLPIGGALGGGAIMFATVTVITAEVVVFPAASLAAAVTICDPLVAVAVSQFAEYGLVVSSAPRLTPSSLNWTPVTAALSEAVALTVTTPLTEAPSAGAVRDTVGATVSRRAVFMSV